ncbi:MAG TPA: tartrate dehydrogenase, partial [Dehalococcoidia bacterium]|nr:tartrate dehydrogenase [Dehalococcoidia bacterium]
DGIGQEVIPVGLHVLEEAARIEGFELEPEEFPWGCEYYLETGRMMAEDWQDQLRGFETIYFGACGWPERVPDHVSLWGMILPIRKQFDLYANVRPVKLLKGVRGPLVGKGPGDIDILCVRENTEGEYAGVGGRLNQGTPDEVALQTAVFTRRSTERIIRYAFDLARQRRKQLASITKSNAQQYGMVFWDEVTAAVARDYPDVAWRSYHVDAAAARFVTHPETLDVVVASNLFADILTDVGGAIQGSLGLAASANIDPERRNPSLFESVHGSAPDIMGMGIANPIATIWAGSLMLDFLGERSAAQRVMRAIERVTEEAKFLTPDMGGVANTKEVGEAVQQALHEVGE